MQLAHIERYSDGQMMQGWHDGPNWFGFILSLLVLASIVWLVVYIVRTLSSNVRSSNWSTRDPMDIARERFAKGEITKEQLADIRKELSI